MSRNEPVARLYVVRGRVQGVGYRVFAERSAERLSLAGYVRNLRDGTVEVYAAGAANSLVSLKQDLMKGPPYARVADVEEREAPLRGLERFTIDY